MMDELFKIDLFEDFSDACDNVFKNLLEINQGPEYENYFINSVRKQLLELISISYGNKDEILDTLINSGYDTNKVKYLVSLVEKRKNELLYMALIEHTCKDGETVVTFDWVIKLICGTSDLKTLKNPIMQLKFATFLNGCNHKERMFELDKTILAKLIEVLENIDQFE